MANHILSLEVPTVMNPCVLTVMDTSIYDDLIPVNCETLNITVPGFSYSVQLDMNASAGGSAFIDNITACDLGIQSTNCGISCADLPDGIYIIKYSVAPNEIVFVEYNHLRITYALNKYYKILCDIDVAACDPPFKVKQRLEELRLIFMYLQAAKSKVEFCLEPQKGMSLYNYALKLLNKMECRNC
jgi:hypothetical protein